MALSFQGSAHQAWVNSGCNQDSVHSVLIQLGALGNAQLVKSLHEDIHQYLLVFATIIFMREKHRIELVVSPSTNSGNKLSRVSGISEVHICVWVLL